MSFLNYLKVECPDHKLAPTRAHEGDAGLDLKSSQIMVVPAGESRLIPTGVKVEIPFGYVGLLFSRSGMAKHGVTLANSVGVIDHEYRGEVKAYLSNSSSNDFFVQYGDRIAQLVILPCALPAVEFVEKVSESTRGENGFGSTGKT